MRDTMAAVRQHGRNIQYIANPSEQIQFAAVQEDAAAISYIKNPTEQVKFLVNLLDSY